MREVEEGNARRTEETLEVAAEERNARQSKAPGGEDSGFGQTGEERSSASLLTDAVASAEKLALVIRRCLGFVRTPFGFRLDLRLAARSTSVSTKSKPSLNHV